MKLSKKGEYALKALVHLSLNYDKDGATLVQIHKISESEKIPEKFLQSILLTLKKAGLLQSHKGVNGGYALNKAPKEITLGDVIRIIDGPLAPVSCVSKTRYISCKDEKYCSFQKVMAQVRQAISDVLDKITFADLCKK
jgi:Rrf2 family protein